MRDYHVTITADPTSSDLPTLSMLEALTDQLEPHAGIVSGGQGHPAGASFTITADNSIDAHTEADRIWIEATTRAGINGAWNYSIVVMTWDAFERSLDEEVTPELLGVSEIAALLDVTRQRAHQLTARDDFPQPIQRLSNGPIWTRPSIQTFIDGWERKAGRPARVAETPGADIVAFNPDGSVTVAENKTNAKIIKGVSTGRYNSKNVMARNPKRTTSETTRSGRKK